MIVSSSQKGKNLWKPHLIRPPNSFNLSSWGPGSFVSPHSTIIIKEQPITRRGISFHDSEDLALRAHQSTNTVRRGKWPVPVWAQNNKLCSWHLMAEIQCHDGRCRYLNLQFIDLNNSVISTYPHANWYHRCCLHFSHNYNPLYTCCRVQLPNQLKQSSADLPPFMQTGVSTKSLSSPPSAQPFFFQLELSELSDWRLFWTRY